MTQEKQLTDLAYYFLSKQQPHINEVFKEDGIKGQQEANGT